MGGVPVKTNQKASQLPEIRINSVTWTRESHGLFDFEGTEIEKKHFRVRGNQRISRYESDVQISATESGDFYE